MPSGRGREVGSGYGTLCEAVRVKCGDDPASASTGRTSGDKPTKTEVGVRFGANAPSENSKARE